MIAHRKKRTISATNRRVTTKIYVNKLKGTSGTKKGDSNEQNKQHQVYNVDYAQILIRLTKVHELTVPE